MRRRLENIDRRLENMHRRLENVHRGLENVHRGLGNMHQGLGNMHRGLGNMRRRLGNMCLGLGNMRRGLGNIKLKIWEGGLLGFGWRRTAERLYGVRQYHTAWGKGKIATIDRSGVSNCRVLARAPGMEE